MDARWIAPFAAGIRWLRSPRATRAAKDEKAFLKRYRLQNTDITEEKRPYFDIAVGEWAHQREEASEAQKTAGFMQFLAPSAAATATVFAAFSSTRIWAVIPAAVATVAAGLLAAFRPREIWFLRRRVRHELAQEIIEFMKDCGEYRGAEEVEKVDRLIGKVREATMTTAQAGAPPD
jgi:hypothetical protein